MDRKAGHKGVKNAWSLIAAAVILTALYVLSTTGKKPPLIPSDAHHATITTQEACLECHAAGKASPLKAGHPPKEQCLICHKVRKI